MIPLHPVPTLTMLKEQNGRCVNTVNNRCRILNLRQMTSCLTSNFKPGTCWTNRSRKTCCCCCCCSGHMVQFVLLLTLHAHTSSSPLDFNGDKHGVALRAARHCNLNCSTDLHQPPTANQIPVPVTIRCVSMTTALLYGHPRAKTASCSLSYQ